MAPEGGNPPGRYVLRLEDIDRTKVAVVGGKAANLGELLRIEGTRVPAGFCVTTEAFSRVMAASPSVDDHLAHLARLEPSNQKAVRDLSADLRRTIEGTAIPDDIAEEVTLFLARLGAQAACAVRSSATVEDLPTSSFAGQQDTYLNIVGRRAVLHHISRCWASLFTERAVAYRQRNAIDHRKVRMAVVVQRMVFPRVAGVLFTADPVNFNRKVTSIEASLGLAEALVSGLVNGDVYKVRDGGVISKDIATKRFAICASPAGGTEKRPVQPDLQDQPALTDPQILELAKLGRRVEAHFAQPQDVEWCLVDDGFQLVQSRPITTLFPVPQAGDGENHVYVSVGHQQMMTDPMKPLGLSMWQLLAPRPMYEAGGRLFVDVTRILGSPPSQANLMQALGESDPLIRDALQSVLDRGDFVPTLADEDTTWALPRIDPASVESDPAIVAQLVERSQASLATLKREIRTKSGSALLDFVLADIEELRHILLGSQSLPVIMAAMAASRWLNDQLYAWLGEKRAADTLTQSVPGNVTSEMGLALLDVADVVRPHPEVVAFLQQVDNDDFLDQLPALEGGDEARSAIQGYLDNYGMRCIGEIDITRPRWSERPSTLVPLVLSNVKNCEPGAAKRRFEQGRLHAEEKEREFLERLSSLPDGQRKAEETKAMTERARMFVGYREYPKYHMISRFFVYKQALLKEAERLVQAHVIEEEEDVFYLRFEEFHDALRTQRVDGQPIRRRKEDFRSYQALTPPRVLTSDGEVVAGAYKREGVPEGALVGLPVSAGSVEGPARVVFDIAGANFEAGDILVTTYTDPSWTPAFVLIKALVTEVGGLMTHGAVIAREYGLPAVVGVENATRLIEDGQWIRVQGTEGYVEITG